MNQLCKYADDTTLIMPQNTIVRADDEFNHVVQWSIRNKLGLAVDSNKTQELIFRQPGLHNYQEPAVTNYRSIERSNI
jgi:hypothetical protein